MSHPIFRIESVEVVAPFTLRLRFNDGVLRTIDFHPVLAGELFGSLRDLNMFNQVRLDEEVHTIVWPTCAHFDPAVLHDWSQHQRAFEAAAKRRSLQDRKQAYA